MVEIAIKLKKLDFSIEQIAEITEILIAEIKKTIKKIKIWKGDIKSLKSLLLLRTFKMT